MSLLIFRGQASSMLGFRPTLVCTNQRSVSQLSTNERRVLRSRDQLCHLYRDLHGRHLHHLPLWAGLGLGLLLLLQLSVHSSLPGTMFSQMSTLEEFLKLPCKDNLARDCQPIGSSLPRPVSRVCLSVKSRGQQNIGC